MSHFDCSFDSDVWLFFSHNVSSICVLGFVFQLAVTRQWLRSHSRVFERIQVVLRTAGHRIWNLEMAKRLELDSAAIRSLRRIHIPITFYLTNDSGRLLQVQLEQNIISFLPP